MNQALTLTVNGRNQASPALRQARTDFLRLVGTVRSSGPALSGGFGNLGGGADRAREAVSRLAGVGGSALSRLGGLASSVLGGVTGVFRSVAGAAVDLAGTLSGTLLSAFQGLVGVATTVSAVLTGVLAAAFVYTAKVGLDFNATMAQGRIGLTAITGSSQQAGAALQQFQGFAKNSLLTLQDVVSMGTQLGRAYGSQGFGQVLPTMSAFDNAAKVNRLSIDSVRLAMLQFRQLVQRDFAQQEELNGIGENMQVNVAGYLRKKFGTADTRELKAAGVSAREVARAIVGGMNDEFTKQAMAAGRTIPLILSAWQDSIAKLAGSVTGKFGKSLGEGLDKGLSAFDKLTSKASVIAALAVPFELVGRAISMAADRMPAFTGWLEQILTRKNVVEVLSQIGGTVKTVAQEVQHFIGIATGGQGMAGIWDSFKAAAQKALTWVIKAWGGFTGGVEFLIQKSPLLWDALTSGAKLFTAAVETAIGAVTVLIGLIAADKTLQGLSALGNFLGGNKGGGGGGGKGGGAALPGTAAGSAAPLAALLPTVASLGTAAYVIKDSMSLFDDLKAIRARADLSPEEKRAAGRDRFRQAFGGSFLPKPTPQEQAILQRVQQREQARQGAHFGGALGTLQDVGKGTLKQLGIAGGAALQIPEVKSVKNFLDGMWEHVQKRAEEAVDRVFGNQAANVAGARKALNTLLGPAAAGAKGKGDGLPPMPFLYGRVVQPGSTAQPESGGAGGLKNPKDLEKAFEAREAFLSALMEEARVAAQALPKSERAMGELQRLLPVLKERQKLLVERSKQLLPKEKEYSDLRREYAQIQGQIQQLEAGAAEAQQEAAKKQAGDARTLADVRVGHLRALLEANPFLNDRQRKEGLLPALMQQFRTLMRPLQGETETERLQRETEAFGAKKNIMESLGFGEKGFVRALGGGMMPLFDTRRARRVMGDLDRIALEEQRSGMSRQMAGNSGSGAAPLVQVNNDITLPAGLFGDREGLQKMFGDHAFRRALGEFMAWWYNQNISRKVWAGPSPVG